MADTPGEVAAEWRSGWPVVVACAFGMTLIGIHYNAVGTFIAPLEKEFGWSRAEVSSAFLVFASVGALTRPFVGALLDRWGSRRLAIPGALLIGLTFASFSMLNGSMVQWLSLWFVLALLFGLVMPTIWTTAVAKNFTRSRGLALGAMMLGSAGSAIAAPLWSNHLIKEYGWRSAYAIMGIGWCSIVALVCFFLLRDRRNDRHGESAPMAKLDAGGYSVRDGIRSDGFIKIVGSILISNMLNMSLSFHLLPILTWLGQPRDTGVWITSTLGLSMIVGTVLYGLIGDRVSPKLLTAILVSIPAITCVMLLYPTNSAIQRAIAVNAFGISAGAQMPSYTNLSTRYYGMRSFGTLSSIAGIATQVATAVAPFIGGVIYDRTHSYTALLIAGVPILLSASLILLSLGRIPTFEPAAPDRVIATA